MIKFDTLDALRGFAAIAVVVYHFHIIWAPTGWGAISWAGYLAVDFFLVLSGFILSHSYLFNKREISVTEFVSHRVSRLYPLHFFTLFIYIFVSLYIDKEFPKFLDGTIFTLIQQLTLTHNIGLNPSSLTYNSPSWSISVEFWVNIIFIIFISKTTKNSTLFFSALIGLLIIYGNTGHLDTFTKNYFTFVSSGMIRGLSSFFIGILSYRIYFYYKNDRRVKKYINYIELFFISGIVFIVFGRSSMTSGIDIFAPFLFMLFIPIFTFESGFISNHIKKYKYLGEISYSI